jgi:hypothetical protein
MSIDAVHTAGRDGLRELAEALEPQYGPSR